MNAFDDKIEMQNRLFSELSRMFGKEVPLYDKALLVNFQTNRTVCSLLSRVHVGFAVSDEQLDKTSGERHGAIRIGRPDEYRWIGRFFACFAMHPHNFYDMANVGAKSQPIIATAFRSVHRPEHRVFTSLLLTDYFDDATRARIEALLAQRTVFSDRAKALIEKSESQGGLSRDDATALIAEGTQRIFKWTGQARDHTLYKELCDAGFKIAADIACFQSHHLNHLTPNTFCMDLYTSAMKMCLGEMDEA
ncbi:MAG: 2-oxoadipate dioxygenase/decarboxylase family protein, partial [Phycisphaerales bacterium]